MIDLTLGTLHDAFDQLQHYGEGSLRAAYTAGQIADALSLYFTYDQMGAEVNRTGQTVAKYAKLYRSYNRVEDLLEASRRYQTFDIGRLTGTDDALRAKFGYQCGNCGSWETHRRSKTPEAVRAAETAMAVRFSGSPS
jgi:hypothetical protein